MQIQVQNLTKSYSQGGTQIEVLKNLHFTILPSEIVAILGQSGSGKSTLLSILSGLESADLGEVSLNQKNLLAMGEAELTQFRSQNMSIVFQQYHLVPHLTALENVELPLEILGRPDEKKAKEILTQVGLSHRLNHFPSQLSGGECQRVAIARALVVAPKFILADEPSGNLDTQTGDSVMNLFFKIVRENKITCILVTHNNELAKRCDRILRIENGTISEAKGMNE